MKSDFLLTLFQKWKYEFDEPDKFFQTNFLKILNDR